MNHFIRNFLITAHVDHGKSTLADRLLEFTGTVPERLMRPQYLDQLELERERGITIKMAPVRMVYRPAESLNPKFESLNNLKIQNSKRLEIRNSSLEIANSKHGYVLNLIDTPGHSDFRYEVSRALTAVEGAILLVDATQGIQAQTLANFESAKRAGLKILGAVTKIDAASSEQIETSVKELGELLEEVPEQILKVSGKTGAGVPELLETVVKRLPRPKAPPMETEASRALVFDSLYDEHKGVIAFVRIFNGTFTAGQDGKLLATGASFKIKETGVFTPALKSAKNLEAGEIGYIATGIKDPDKLKIGDTLLARIHADSTRANAEFQRESASGLRQSAGLALPGYEEPKPVVFVSFYPENAQEYEKLRRALGLLRLNDAALKFEPDMSEILGRGFKGGFLGRLHFEITADRLLKEFHIPTVHSFPSVAYQIKIKNNGWLTITNPKDFPDDAHEVLEPITKVEILTPPRFLGAVLELKEIFRFSDIEMKTSGSKTLIAAKLPLADLVSDLDDKLKSVSEGFASLSYETAGLERAEVDKLEVLVVGEPVAGLTRIVPKKFIEHEARSTVLKLKDLLPKQQFTQAIQARTRGRIIARETIPAMRKDVTGYLYGGDRTRKMKLWKKQQKGKKKLERLAGDEQVKIPAHIFKELLKK